MGRSVLAVVVGYLVMAIAVVALFAVWFREPNAVPSRGSMLFSLSYGFLFGVVGGYVTALIARRSEVRHAIALAGLLAIRGAVPLIASAGQEPLWYQVATILVMVFAVMLGGYLRARQRGTAKARTPLGA
jgi:hypothetical protein